MRPQATTPTNLRRALVFLVVLGLSLSLSAKAFVNASNQEAIDEERLKLILIGKERFWHSGTEVAIALLKDDAHSADTLARYSDMTPSKFRNYWRRIAFSGRGKLPRTFNTLEELRRYVRETEGALGIVAEDDAIAGFRLIRFEAPTLSKNAAPSSR